MDAQPTDGPTLWLCLDLCPKPGTPIPEGESINDLLVDARINSEGWVRNWQVFDSKQGADAHAADAPNIVVMPLILEGPYQPG